MRKHKVKHYKFQDNADVRILFTGREYTASAGYAYTKTLCRNNKFSVAVLKFFWYEKLGGKSEAKVGGVLCQVT